MMMWFDRHRRFPGRLSAYIDGELDAPAAERLERHLAECARCRTELAQLRATVAALQELPQAEPRRSFALSPEQAARRRSLPAAPPLAFGARIAAAGVAVALAAVLVVDIGDLGGDGAPQGAPAMQMLADRQADGAGFEAAAEEADGAAPAAPEADEEGAAGRLASEADAGETPAAGGAPVTMPNADSTEAPAAGPEEAEAPAAAPADGGGIDALTAAEIGLAIALGVLVSGSFALAFAGRKR